MFVHTRDNRVATKGFTGLFHAAFADSAVVFQFLYQIEREDYLDYDITIDAPAISPTARYSLASNSSVGMLLLLRNSYKMSSDMKNISISKYVLLLDSILLT